MLVFLTLLVLAFNKSNAVDFDCMCFCRLMYWDGMLLGNEDVMDLIASFVFEMDEVLVGNGFYWKISANAHHRRPVENSRTMMMWREVDALL